MTHRIKEVESKENFMIEAVFFNGQIVQYDVKSLFLVFPQFQMLEDNQELFKNVKV